MYIDEFQCLHCLYIFRKRRTIFNQVGRIGWSLTPWIYKVIPTATLVITHIPGGLILRIYNIKIQNSKIIMGRQLFLIYVINHS